MHISLPVAISPAHVGILHLPVLCATQHWWVMKSQAVTSCVCTRERSDLEREPSLKIAAEKARGRQAERERKKSSSYHVILPWEALTGVLIPFTLTEAEPECQSQHAQERRVISCCDIMLWLLSISQAHHMISEFSHCNMTLSKSKVCSVAFKATRQCLQTVKQIKC